MGNVIRRTATTAAILRDVELTLSHATALGAPVLDDAERFLGEVATRADALAAGIDDAQERLRLVTSEQTAENHGCNDLIGRIKDEYWNDIGRTLHDPIFELTFPGGAVRYRSPAPASKPDVMLLLVGMLEGNVHPLVAPERIADMATRLQDAGAKLAEVNGRLVPIRQELRLLAAQETANARLGALQLARLKKFWAAMGRSEVDIHRVIPDRPALSRRKAAELEELPEAPVEEAEVPLTVVVDEELETELAEDMAAK